MKILETINLWFKIGRGYTIPPSVVPYLFAVVLAAKQCNVNWFLSLLGLIGVVLVHISMNMLDDYFDWKNGAVEEYKKLLDTGMQARTHKCFYVEQNLATIDQVLAVALTYDAIACVLGFYIALKVGFSVVLIALIAGILGISYSAPPLKLGYRGLGELAIGIIFGPLIMAGAYITAGANLDAPLLFSSVILGLLIANIAHTHAIMDFDSDVKVGKTSLSTFLKTKDNAIIAQALIYLSAYALVAIGIYLKIYPIACALTFITLPIAIGLVRLMKSESKEKRFWMEFIENWKQFQEEGSDWFMMRLCLSRNIMTDFTVVLGVTYYLFGG